MYSLGPDSVGLGWDPGICFSIRACQKILGSQVQELLLKPIQIMSHCRICVRREVLGGKQVNTVIRLGKKSWRRREGNGGRFMEIVKGKKQFRASNSTCPTAVPLS